jgi:hypothetical protein
MPMSNPLARVPMAAVLLLEKRRAVGRCGAVPGSAMEQGACQSTTGCGLPLRWLRERLLTNVEIELPLTRRAHSQPLRAQRRPGVMHFQLTVDIGMNQCR